LLLAVPRPRRGLLGHALAFFFLKRGWERGGLWPCWVGMMGDGPSRGVARLRCCCWEAPGAEFEVRVGCWSKLERREQGGRRRRRRGHGPWGRGGRGRRARAECGEAESGEQIPQCEVRMHGAVFCYVLYPLDLLWRAAELGAGLRACLAWQAPQPQYHPPRAALTTYLGLLLLLLRAFAGPPLPT
jgi:hypothetical protein